MDREHILAAVPHGDQFEQLHPQQKQSTTIDLAQVMLTAVEDDGRELDEWQGLGLLEALGL